MNNCVKMHKALEQALYFLRRHHMGAVYAPDGETLIFCEEVIDIVDAALSEPPRNCDRFANELDTQLAFLNEVWLISVDRETMLERDKYENWTDEMRARYGRWLLAPKVERKGEGDD